jgi:4-amino-4-deoxy-L-arabinose transferase-like glycosyltransferase
VYRLAKELFRSQEIAIAALLIYFSMPAVLVSARNLTTDSYLATFELLAIWAWVKYKIIKAPVWLYLFYIALALAFLTKGPVGLIFPVLVVISLSNYSSGVKKSSLIVHQLIGLAIFLILGASWYLYLMLQDRQFVDYFLMRHVVERYANPEAFSRSKPWWFYIVLAPALSLPWSAILLLNFKQLRKLEKHFKKLFIVWLLVSLLFFSFSGSKLLLYILPLFAGLALLCAWLLYQLPDATKRKVAAWGIVYYTVLAIAFLLIPLFPVDLPILYWVYSLPLLMLLCLYLIWKSESDTVVKLLLGSAAFTILLLPFSTYLLAANPSLTNSSTALAQALQAKELRHRQVVVYDKLLPSLAFELNRNFVTIQANSRSLNRETQFETDTRWKDHFLQLNKQEDSTALASLLRKNVVLVVKGDLPEEKQWLIKHLHKKRKAGKWSIYF